MVLADRRYSPLLTRLRKLLKEAENTESIDQVDTLGVGEGFESEVTNSLVYGGQAGSLHKRSRPDIPKYGGEERWGRAADSGERGEPCETGSSLL